MGATPCILMVLLLIDFSNFNKDSNRTVKPNAPGFLLVK